MTGEAHRLKQWAAGVNCDKRQTRDGKFAQYQRHEFLLDHIVALAGPFLQAQTGSSYSL
ncbi:hypothetical protein SAMN05216411_1153 [Nitrosospira multiformis]|nr:hypothetical protein SAMN05216411_1153 [Nitrosospira multiformis]